MSNSSISNLLAWSQNGSGAGFSHSDSLKLNNLRQTCRGCSCCLEGDWIVRADTTAQERFILPDEKFQRLYGATPMPLPEGLADRDELEAEGFKACVSMIIPFLDRMHW